MIRVRKGCRGMVTFGKDVISYTIDDAHYRAQDPIPWKTPFAIFVSKIPEKPVEIFFSSWRSLPKIMTLEDGIVLEIFQKAFDIARRVEAGEIPEEENNEHPKE